MFKKLSLLISFFEYIPLRIVRKYLFTENVLDVIGAYIPYYKVNHNRVDSSAVALKYDNILRKLKTTKELSILEIGAGATNAVAYELARLGYKEITCYEPFMPFDKKNDDVMLEKICTKYALKKNEIISKVKRIQSLDEAKNEQVFDVVISNHVLEHVIDSIGLFQKISVCLKKGGVQIHFVGYLDHFFKYPYHLLVFNKNTWNRFLNPRNLPGWRLYDHLRMFKKLGFNTEVLEIQRDSKKFEEIKNYISKDYEKDNEYIDVNYCTIIVSKI